jgi:hypothetical protein
MPDSIVSGDRCYYCGMEVWQETTSWLGNDDLSYNCPGKWPKAHYVRRVESAWRVYEDVRYALGEQG